MRAIIFGTSFFADLSVNTKGGNPCRGANEKQTITENRPRQNKFGYFPDLI